MPISGPLSITSKAGNGGCPWAVACDVLQATEAVRALRKPVLWGYWLEFSQLDPCMYVCMYVSIYVCMYVCMDGWMDGWMDGCVYVYVYVYVCVCVRMYFSPKVAFLSAAVSVPFGAKLLRPAGAGSLRRSRQQGFLRGHYEQLAR